MKRKNLIKFRNKFIRNSKFLYAVSFTFLGISFTILIIYVIELMCQPVNYEYNLLIAEHGAIFYTIFFIPLILGLIFICMALNILYINTEIRLYFHFYGIVDEAFIKSAIEDYNNQGIKAFCRAYADFKITSNENEILKKKLHEYETKYKVGNRDKRV